MFPDLAFVRFSVYDNNNNHLISQRVVPLKCLRQGYRHVRLRNSQNQTLELSSLFIYSRLQLDHVQNTPSSLVNISGLHSSSTTSMVNKDESGGTQSKAKHKQFKLTVYGLNGDDEERDQGIVVKVTQETTVQQVIEQVLK